VKEIEHPAARWMADRPEDIRIASHHHVVNIRKQTLTRQGRSAPLRNGPLAQ
jgi:hypothetical protein